MPRFGIVGPSYTSQSLNADAQLCMNWYVEQIESGAGNAPVVLYPTPGTLTFVNLGRTVTPEVDGLGALDAAIGATGFGTAVATGALTPSTTPEFALFGEAKDDTSGFTFTPNAGWTIFGSQTYEQEATGSINGQGTIGGGSANWAAALALFQQIGATPPATIQTKTINSGTFAAGVYTQSFTLPVTAGNSIIVILEGNLSSGDAAMTVSDGVNTYAKVIGEFNSAGNKPQYTMYIAQGIAAGTPAVAATTHATISGQITMYEVQGGTAAVTNSGPTRGCITITGRTFFVVGTDFDEVFANGTFTTWGEVANDSLPVTMAATPQQLLLASAGTAYVFDLTANTLTPIAGATFSGPVAQAAVCDDFFILTIKASKTFYVSAPLDATDWVTNGSAIVSVFPDNIVSMIVDHRQVWFFSDTKSVVYYDSGNIFPFDVIPGSFMEAGNAAEFSTQLFPNGVVWLGSDERGTGVVWLGPPGGGTPTRISNHALEFAIQGYTRIDDAVAITYQDQGHLFYQIYFPTPSVTWTYDVNTQMWHQRGFFVEAIGDFRAVHYWNHTYNFGKHLVGDWQSGRVYQLHIPVLTAGVWTFATDDGNPIVRIRRAPHISQEQKRQFHSELQVYVETGLGPQPPISIPYPYPTTVILPDISVPTNSWQVSIGDDGTPNFTSSIQPSQAIFMNHNGVSYQAFSNGTNFEAVAVTFNPSYPATYPMATTPSFNESGLVVT
jgi:hypothetical protein